MQCVCVCRQLDVNVCPFYSDHKMHLKRQCSRSVVNYLARLDCAGLSLKRCLETFRVMKIKPPMNERRGHSQSHMVWILEARWSWLTNMIPPYIRTIATSLHNRVVGFFLLPVPFLACPCSARKCSFRAVTQGCLNKIKYMKAFPRVIQMPHKATHGRDVLHNKRCRIHLHKRLCKLPHLKDLLFIPRMI